MFNTETKTVTVEVADYSRRYRDIEQFLVYCRACPNYGHCWSCPPHDFAVETALDDYAKGVLIATQINVDEEMRQKAETAKDRQTFAEGLIYDYRQVLDDMLLVMEQAIPGSRAFFAGSCHFCEQCTRGAGEPCRHPQRRRVSLEAIGFDLARTTSELFGIELQWGNDDLPPYFTLVSALFLKK